MGKIVAIGGGTHLEGETLKIDRKIIELTGKEHPHLLYISTASDSEPEYSNEMTGYFESLGCTTEKLSLILDNFTDEEIKEKILSPDIIYVGGGDTIRLVYFWRALGVDKYLRQAYEKGIVMAGVSAGGMCWFSYGHTDSLCYYTRDWDYYRFPALGYIPAVFSPHFNRKRKSSLKKWMEKGESYPAVALENGTAMLYCDGKASIIKGIPKAKAYIYYPEEDGKFTVISPKEGQEFNLQRGD